MKLSATLLNITQSHEGCRIRAAEEGVLEYLLMEAIPALSKGKKYGEEVSEMFYKPNLRKELSCRILVLIFVKNISMNKLFLVLNFIFKSLIRV